MKIQEFKKALAEGFRVLQLMSRFEIECRSCGTKWNVSKRDLRRLRGGGILHLLNHEYAHKNT